MWSTSDLALGLGLVVMPSHMSQFLDFGLNYIFFLVGTNNKNAWPVTHFMSLTSSQSPLLLFLMIISCKVM